MTCYLVSDHDVGNLGLAVHVFMFLLVGEDREHEVTWFTLALAYQETAWLALVRKQLLSVAPREVPVVPPSVDRQTIYDLCLKILILLKSNEELGNGNHPNPAVYV